MTSGLAYCSTLRSLPCNFCVLVIQGAASPFRDNDGLAALLAVELQADLLVLLTDVDGLYTGPPTAESSL